MTVHGPNGDANRQRTGYTCSKTQIKKWKLYRAYTTCTWGRAEETTAHILQYSEFAHPCSLDDLIMFNDVGKQCAELWEKDGLMTIMSHKLID